MSKFLLLYSMPNLLLSFSNNFSTCTCQISLSSIQSPKNFVKPTLGISTLFSTTSRSGIFACFSNNIYTVLLQFRVSLFALNQSCIFIKSDSTQYLK